ncbi:hypothetical protein CC78DRAFT_579009 [Lojkania enalia]|uniref:Uncharacterized protein n=1 Tax=Lojkania enalia TaxID=147567 RepID=A0A9P4KBY0_9PLEO|nr:hypothetical protein CC78DRAFT_579009 [Didymosphaeria enalia]
MTEARLEAPMPASPEQQTSKMSCIYGYILTCIGLYAHEWEEQPNMILVGGPIWPIKGCGMEPVFSPKVRPQGERSIVGPSAGKSDEGNEAASWVSDAHCGYMYDPPSPPLAQTKHTATTVRQRLRRAQGSPAKRTKLSPGDPAVAASVIASIHPPTSTKPLRQVGAAASTRHSPSASQLTFLLALGEAMATLKSRTCASRSRIDCLHTCSE